MTNIAPERRSNIVPLRYTIRFQRSIYCLFHVCSCLRHQDYHCSSLLILYASKLRNWQLLCTGRSGSVYLNLPSSLHEFSMVPNMQWFFCEKLDDCSALLARCCRLNTNTKGHVVSICENMMPRNDFHGISSSCMILLWYHAQLFIGDASDPNH